MGRLLQIGIGSALNLPFFGPQVREALRNDTAVPQAASRLALAILPPEGQKIMAQRGFRPAAPPAA